MAIVTLTTDLGITDHFVAAIKGRLLQTDPSLILVDISHNVKTHDIVQAAYILRNAYVDFPEGTIHLASIHNLSEADSRLVVFSHRGHFFVGPDNGLFSLVLEELPQEVRQIPLDSQSPFPIKEAFARAVDHLLVQQTIEALGSACEEMVEKISLYPVVSEDQLRGTVIYIDHFGNAVINIRRNLFERVQDERRFELFFKRHDPIRRLSRHYRDVAVGEPLCLFNASGHLEVAVNAGRASTLLGLKVEDTIQINFFDV